MLFRVQESHTPAHYHWICDDKGNPANKQECAEDDGGHVLQYGIHRSFWSGRRLAEHLVSILWDGRVQVFCGTPSNINRLKDNQRLL